MAVIGGDIKEVKWSHPTLGSGVFYPKSGEDSTLDLGGYRNSDDANSASGDMERIYEKTFSSPMFEVMIAVDTRTRLDIEVLVQLSETTVEAVWELSHVNGSVYKMRGLPVGDIQGNLKAATMTLKVMGSGRMEKIV